MAKRKNGRLEEIFNRERIRLGNIKSEITTKNYRETREYFYGYTDAVVYFQKILMGKDRTDFVELIKKYLP